MSLSDIQEVVLSDIRYNNNAGEYRLLLGPGPEGVPAAGGHTAAGPVPLRGRGAVDLQGQAEELLRGGMGTVEADASVLTHCHL